MNEVTERLSSDAKDVAFKVNWNDGTRRADAEFPGWSDVCSPTTLALNVRSGRPWCSNSKCDCSR